MVGVYKFDSIKDITRRAFKFWLAALIVSLSANVYRIVDNAKRIEMETKAIKAAGRANKKDLAAEKTLGELKS